MKIIIHAITSIIIIVTLACVQEVDTDNDRYELLKITKIWDKAFNSGDIRTLVSLYTDDAKIIPPNMKPVIGTEAIREYFNAEFESFSNYKINDPADEVIILGNKAYVRGKYFLNYTPKLGEEQLQDEGNWIMLFGRQTDGSWKCYYEIFNSKMPLPKTML
jgi:ketosteroid isomerase-like protein